MTNTELQEIFDNLLKEKTEKLRSLAEEKGHDAIFDRTQLRVEINLIRYYLPAEIRKHFPNFPSN